MTRKLRFGLQLDFRNPAEWRQPWDRFYQETVEFAAWTESLGFDDVWLSEHHAADDGYLPSPLIAATAIAARTSRIRIGAAIAIGPLYHPVRLAEDCAVLDLLSGGRLEIGVGLGYREAEFEGYGISKKERGGRTDELLQIMRRLWQGETLDFAGRYFNLKGARIQPLPLQKHLPLWVGGFNTPAFKRAAKFGDGIIGGGDVDFRWREYADALKAEGKDPEKARLLSSLQWLVVSEDPDKTFAEVAPHVLHQINTYAEWLQGALPGQFRPMDLATLKSSGTLQVLTPEDTIATIHKVLEKAPVEGIYGFIPPAGYPLKKLAPHIELFATKVMPAFH